MKGLDFYEDLHEIIEKMEKDSTVVSEHRLDDLFHAYEELKKFFPEAEIKTSIEHRGLTRTGEIWVRAKQFDISAPKEFLNIIKKADYFTLSCLFGDGVSICVGFEGTKVEEE